MRTSCGLLLLCMLLSTTNLVSGSCPLWGDCTKDSSCCTQGSCYEANQWYAQCRDTCSVSGWTCKKLSSTSSSSKATPTPTSKSNPTPASKATPTPTSKSTPTPTSKSTPTPASKSTPTPTSKATPTPTSKTTPTPASSSSSASKATDITKLMGVGWNLGNTLDASGGETNWGNPKTTKAMITSVRNKGFKTLRVPVSWDGYTGSSPSYTITASWLTRVEEVVNYGLDNGMYVIINVHHHTGWEEISTSNEAAATARLQKLWAQIGTHFAGYGNTLIFEIMNEPRTGDDWWGAQTQFDIVNRMNAAAVTTIRALGGNNSKRLLMLPNYVAGPHEHMLTATKLPSDSMVAVSVHAYLPYEFSMLTSGYTTFTDTSAVDTLFTNLNTYYVSKAIAVVLGEWATTNKDNTAERVKHAKYYSAKAKALNIPTIVWDNGYFDAYGSDAMGLYDRKNDVWKFADIVSAIVNA